MSGPALWHARTWRPTVRRISLGLFAVLSGIACHRYTYGPEPLKTDGFRYSVGSDVVGAALDTLRVAVVVVNGSREERSISVPTCPPRLNPVNAILRAQGKEWSSETLELSKYRQYLDSTDRQIEQVCMGGLLSMIFRPGGSHTYVLKVPVLEVLGDSLPDGRYRVTAQLRLNGHLTRRFAAADVELAAPRRHQ